MPKNKLIAIIVLVVVGALGAYKFVLAPPAPAGAKPKVDGVVYVLPKEFLVNLSDGRYAKFSVAMVLDHAPEAGGHEETPPEGYGVMPEEAVVRDVITDVVGASTGSELSTAEGREKVKKLVRRKLKLRTDLHVGDVLLPDITVQ
ncbi:flagellar basal body-associated FliL family protein [Patulibacter minatonensis]|uniref:flagellar basal body-associated FliL family protein n=1 Tax=Patulibacter minatonensis TaxID=298163 RepID=UPI00047CDEE1|nr:flagellar basal body-associated FliL family protein [Patulibacter minatonensis]